jgi:hypothetical protein
LANDWRVELVEVHARLAPRRYDRETDSFIPIDPDSLGIEED